MTVKKCPESGTRRSLRSTLALWAGRIVINSHRGRNQYPKWALAGDAFFRWPLNTTHPRGAESINEEKGDALGAARSRTGEETTMSSNRHAL
jgi:hypothetical protein